MYAKLFASLYQGTLRGNADAILVFTNLLAHADCAGTVDKHFRAIADEVGLSVERVKKAITFLESPDPESRSPDHDGRRLMPLDEHRAWGWQIVNHGKYRAIRSEEERREQNREAQTRWRERQKISNVSQDKPSVSNISQRKPSVSKRNTDKPIQMQIQKQIQIQKQEEEESEREIDVTSAPKPKPDQFPIPRPDVDPALWAEWLAMRVKLKKPFTSHGYNRLIADLGKLVAFDLNERLELAIDRKWLGLIFVEDKNGRPESNGQHQAISAKTGQYRDKRTVEAERLQANYALVAKLRAIGDAKDAARRERALLGNGNGIDNQIGGTGKPPATG